MHFVYLVLVFYLTQGLGKNLESAVIVSYLVVLLSFLTLLGDSNCLNIKGRLTVKKRLSIFIP